MFDKIFNEIFSSKELIAKPPVLVDIGASGKIHSEWKSISRYSICIAFDPDIREMRYLKNIRKKFKELHIIDKIATHKSDKNIDFYLTDSPFCSSTLRPNMKELNNYSFSNLFKIVDKKRYEAVNIKRVINNLKTSSIDWFKTDSQGTDLKLFKFLDEKIIKNILVADFEPGIINAYEGEDKLYSVMEYMDNQPFWICSMTVNGPERVKQSFLNNENIAKYFKYGNGLCDSSPGWAEVTYFNNFEAIKPLTRRKLLLGCVFAIIKNQLGFGLELAYKGEKLYNDIVFSNIKKWILKTLKVRYLKKKLFDFFGFPIKIVARLIRIFP